MSHRATIIDGMGKEAAQAELDVGPWAEPTADHTAYGIMQYGIAGEAVVFGNLLYLKSDGKWWKADADAAATMPGLRMALAAADADASIFTLVMGHVRDDTWAWTVGGIIYASTDAGGLTQTAPTGSADIVQVVGVASHADRMLFQPSLDMVEIQ